MVDKRTLAVNSAEQTLFEQSMPDRTQRKRLTDIGFYSDVKHDGSLVTGVDRRDLCEFCRGPELEGFLARNSQDVLIPHFKEQWPATTCPACQLFQDVLIREHGRDAVEKAMQLEGFSCKLFDGFAFPDCYLHSRDVADMRRIQVMMGKSRTFAKWDKNEAIGDGYLSGLIDVLLPKLQIQNSTEKYVQVRVPRKRRCDVSQIREWISMCDEQHDHTIYTDRKVDKFEGLIASGRFRLIDVETGAIAPSLRLERYVALSYVWGQSMSHFATTHKKEHGAGLIDLTRVPATVRDAIELVKSLGQQYIWVDAVCIDQTDAEDKEANINAMSAIYSNACFTIFAANGKDAHDGLLRLHEHPSSIRESVVMVGSYGLLPGVPTLKFTLDSTVWQSRAWTYQERVLSTRRLYFTDDEVLFQCPDEEFRECYTLVSVNESSARTAVRSSGRPKSRDPEYVLGQTGSFNRQHYTMFVESYSPRRLTHAGDRLDAFKAVLDRFSAGPTNSYQEIAESGIPLAVMPEGLCWNWTAREDNAMHRNPGDARGSRLFPSWSWAGWSSFELQFRPFGKGSYHIELEFEVLDENNIIAKPFRECPWPPWEEQPSLCRSTDRGQVTIHLRAPVFEVRLIPKAENQPESGCVYHNIVYVGTKGPGRADNVIGTVGLHESYALLNQGDKVYEAIWYPTNQFLLTEPLHGLSVRVPFMGSCGVNKEYVKEVGSVKHIMLQ